MTLLQEITYYSDLYWAGIIDVDQYYFLVDLAIKYGR